MTSEHLNVLIFTSIAAAVLGVGVWWKDRRQSINRYFAVFALSGAVWTLCNGFVSLTAATPWGVVWARFAFASAAIIPLAFLWFTSVFPSPEPPVSKRILGVASFSGLSALLLSLTPLIATTTTEVNRTLQVHYGPLHPFFGGYFVISFGYAWSVLARKRSVLTGIQRVQINYVLAAVAITALGATTTNLIIPVLLGSSRFSAYGPLFGLFLVTLIAHAIIRHRLLNIGLVLRRHFRYLLAGIAAAGFLVVALEVGWRLLISGRTEFIGPQLVGLALLVVFFFQPLKQVIQDSIDRYFFRQPYSYQRVIRQITREMAGILDLQALLHYLARVVGETVQCEHVSLYTRADSRDTAYRRWAVWTEFPINLPNHDTVSSRSALTAYMRTVRSHLLIDEPATADRSSAQAELRRLGAHFAVPLLGEEGLAGFLLLGPRRSGDPYFTEDIDLLVTVAGQATIALKNAQLYFQLAQVEAEKRRAERLASIGSLAAGLAHEIKNPLVAIKAFAELLPERFNDEEFRGDFAKVAGREIERIDDLVQRLAGLAAGAAERHVPVDIREPIDETLALLRGQLQQAQISLKALYSPDLRLIVGDKAQLKQLFLNLFLNAIEAMHSGGELLIHAHNRQAAGRELVTVEVSDAGQGIPKNLLSSIFDPFVTTKPTGSGLGLSISRGIADAHQATIHARNNASRRGTTIIVEFPVVEMATATEIFIHDQP